MGNQKSNLNYITGATNELEEKIRRFEINVLLSKENNQDYERSFGSIYSQICFDSELFQGKDEDNLKKFLVTIFIQKMADFVTNQFYFKIEEEIEFDMRKIRILLFLLTFNTNTILNKNQNPDKVKFNLKKNLIFVFFRVLFYFL